MPDRRIAPRPAPAPQLNAAVIAAANTSGKPPGGSAVDDEHKETDSDLARSTGSMAIATLASRITGFLRNVALIATIGPAIGSAFLTANTLPNLITEVVLGAVLTALVVPVLVRAEKEDADKGEAFMRRLFTLSFTLLFIVTCASVAAAPLLAQLPLQRHGDVNIIQATAFAYLLLPQIIFYGIFALFMAILNTKGIYKPGAWAPVVNNVVVLGVLIAYWLLPGHLSADAPAGVTNPHIALLGVGTTAGVVVQALIMVPYLKKAGINLKPLWGLDNRLRQFGTMALAIVIYVAISQAGYIVATRIASVADDRAPTIYQQSWLLLQVPYGIIGVTLLTAIMPRLSRNAARGDHTAVVHDLTLAMKLTLMCLIPVIVFMTAFGTQIANALFAYGRFTHEDATILGWTLSFSAFGLIPYAMVLLHLRVFYAREKAWTPTLIIAGITGTKIVLSMAAPYLATSRASVVVLLAAANGFGFAAGAIIGVVLLKRQLGSLHGKEIMRTCVTVGLASIIAGLIIAGLDAGFVHITGGDPARFGSVGYFVRTAIFGLIFVGIAGLIIAKSGLPEVAALAVAARRLPVVGKLIHAPRVADEAAAAPSPQPLTQPVAQELASQVLTVDSFEGSPVPPPMSAGLVRDVRQVPGATIANGRFRLLTACGFAGDARLWQAEDKATGRRVGLSIVEARPKPGQSLTQALAELKPLCTRTAALREVSAAVPDGIAPGITATTAGANVIIAADWVEGSPLGAVAETAPDPRAAALAVSHVAAAAAAAHAKGLVAGIADLDQLRVSTTGAVVLAFPVVFDDARAAGDIAACGLALDALCAGADEVPEPIAELMARCLAPATATDDNKLTGPVITAEKLAEALTAAALGKAGSAPTRGMITIPTDTHPARPERAPHDQPAGFSRPTYSRKATAVIVTLSIALVVLAAVLAVYVMGIFNGSQPDSPVAPQNPITKLAKKAQTGAPALGDQLTDSAAPGAGHNDNPLDAASSPARLVSAVEWQPVPHPRSFDDNPAQAPRTIDGDPATTWKTDVYRNQFAAPPAGLKAGVGILVTLDKPARISSVTVGSPSTGAGMVIYGVDAKTRLKTLSQARPLAHLDVTQPATTVRINDDKPYGKVLVWVNHLPATPHQAAIGTIAVNVVTDRG